MSVMVRFHTGALAAVVPGGMKIQPESKPPVTGWHGLANDDCVTVLLPGAPVNWKEIMSPTFAGVFDGMYWKTPPGVLAVPPTWTTETV